VVAEDLGVITPEVEALRDRFRFPGMRVLQFGFDGDGANPHRPHNNVATAWSTPVLTTTTPRRVCSTVSGRASSSWCGDYLGLPSEPMPWPLIRAARKRRALAVVPMQDLLGLGYASPHEPPGTTEGNLAVAFDWSRCRSAAGEVRGMVEEYRPRLSDGSFKLQVASSKLRRSVSGASRVPKFAARKLALRKLAT